MTRGDFVKACGLVAVGTALMRPVRALARRAEPEPATLPPDSAYERMKRLRIDYMLAAGDPQRRYAINREFIALAFEMKAAGAVAHRHHDDGTGDALSCEARGRPAARAGMKAATEKTPVTFGSGSDRSLVPPVGRIKAQRIQMGERHAV
jgi:hypothetical protein